MYKDFNKVKFNYNKLNLTYRQTRYNSSYYSHNMGLYLGGLLEGDGHIAVHDKNYKSKVYRPKIFIVFNINDNL
jgi:hypothetical protein